MGPDVAEATAAAVTETPSEKLGEGGVVGITEPVVASVLEGPLPLPVSEAAVPAAAVELAAGVGVGKRVAIAVAMLEAIIGSPDPAGMSCMAPSPVRFNAACAM